MAILALAMAVNMMAGDFVKVKNGRFIRGGKPYYYVGMGPYLALKDRGATVCAFVGSLMSYSV